MSQLDAFTAYTTYLAIKLHFTSGSYDFFRYGGKVNATPATFEAKNDKYFFAKLARKYKKEEFQNFILANIIPNPKTYSRELVSSEADALFREYQKTIESLSYHFSNEINTLMDYCEENGTKFQNLLVVNYGEVPTLFTLYYSNVITIQTIAILEKVLGFMSAWNKKIKDDILWPKQRLILEKYIPFLDIDVEKYKAILKGKL